MQLTRASGHGPITLDANQVIGSGGEAKVYAVKGNRSVVAKVYHQPTPERAGKLRAMVGHAPADPGSAQGHVSIAWPEDLLLEPGGTVAGYLMPAIRDSYPFSDVYHPGARKKSLPAGFGYQYLLRTAHNLCSAVSAVHAMGYVIGDLNDCNILVQADARVTLIDCDSFQVGPYRCTVGRPEYTAPELQGVTLSSVDRQAEQDCFGLAVLVHQLLMSGVHPYAGVGEPGALDERIKAALCPYAPGGPKPPRGAPLLEWLPPPLQQLVRATFVGGQTVPSARPEARVWAERLLAAEKGLATCRRDISHPHFNHLPECPACQVQAARLRKARKPQAPQGTGNPWQQPLPGLRVRAKGGMRQRIVMAMVLTTIAALAYHWPSLRGAVGQLTMPFPSNTGGNSGTSTYSRAIPAPRARKPHELETGSDIHRKQIGQNPYRRPDVGGPIGAGLPIARNRSLKNNSMSGVPQLYDLESGSDIYRRYIGKSPY